MSCTDTQQRKQSIRSEFSYRRQAVQVFRTTQTQHRLKPKHTPQRFQRKHIDMVIMCNKKPLKSAAEIQADLMMTVPALSASPKHYLYLYMFMHI